MFEHYDKRARGCVVLAREESIRLGRAETGAEHLLLGIAALDPDLVGVSVERLRAALVALHGVGSEVRQEMVQLSHDALAALEGANAQALALGHTTIDPAHLLLAVLDADGPARRVLRESGLTVADVRERATLTAGLGPPAGRSVPEEAPPAPSHEQRLRDGDPVPVTLGTDPLPIGDLGHPSVDARLLALHAGQRHACRALPARARHRRGRRPRRPRTERAFVGVAYTLLIPYGRRMKLAIAGKGGAGKTTISGTLARQLARQGYEVLALDNDLNPNLSLTVGIPADRMSDMPGLPDDLVRRVEGGYEMTRTFEELRASNGVSGPDGVTVLIAHEPRRADTGCMGRYHMGMRGLVNAAPDIANSITILDTESSVEHLKVGTAKNVHALYAVVEPYYKSLESGRRVLAMARDLGIEQLALLANKVRPGEEEVVQALRRRARPRAHRGDPVRRVLPRRGACRRRTDRLRAGRAGGRRDRQARQAHRHRLRRQRGSRL